MVSQDRFNSLNDSFEIGLILLGSFFGGFVNAIAGGGGLVSLPVMLNCVS